jgi:hypothetical protein
MINLLPIPALTIDDMMRFWSKVNRDGNNCWLWTAYCNPDGYGLFRLGGRKGTMYLAPRVSYKIHVQDPGPLLVLHDCNNPPCVNPDHLWSGAQADNIRQAGLEGRKSSTPWHCTSLNEAMVRRIKHRLDKGESLVSIAKDNGVNPQTIGDIRRGKTWRWV